MRVWRTDLYALAELLEIPVHVADGAQRVVGGQEDLTAVDQGLVWVGGEELGGVARDRGLDLRLARRDDPRVKVDLHRAKLRGGREVGGRRRKAGGGRREGGRREAEGGRQQAGGWWQMAGSEI